MKLKLISIGKPQLSFAKSGIAEYTKRISRFASFDFKSIKEDKNSEKKILKFCEKSFLILLDEKGKEFSSEEFAHFLEEKKNHSQNICFVVAGADGHSQDFLKKADLTLSLSRFTFPHDMATLLFTEILYRALSMNAGHPYHRA